MLCYKVIHSESNFIRITHSVNTSCSMELYTIILVHICLPKDFEVNKSYTIYHIQNNRYHCLRGVYRRAYRMACWSSEVLFCRSQPLACGWPGFKWTCWLCLLPHPCGPPEQNILLFVILRWNTSIASGIQSNALCRTEQRHTTLTKVLDVISPTPTRQESKTMSSL